MKYFSVTAVAIEKGKNYPFFRANETENERVMKKKNHFLVKFKLGIIELRADHL